MRSIGAWCFRHRRLVVLAWLAAFLIATAVARAEGSAYTNSFTLPHTESTKALDLLQTVSRRESGDREQIVVATGRGTKVTDPAVRSQVEAMLGRVASLPHVSSVISPYSPQGAEQVSRDGSVAFATVIFDIRGFVVSDAAAKQFVATARSATSSTLKVAVAGQVAQKSNMRGLGGSGVGILAAAVVLFLVFGSLTAMALPLVSALVSLGTATSLIALLSHVMKMPQFSDQLIVLIGLGVGVDYALFIVSRHRQALLRGTDVESSVVTAVDTSGRAVLFAGIIVCIALLGMFALRVSFLYGLAIASSIGVLFTMAAALTLLPALLGFIGIHILSRRQRRLMRTGAVVHEDVAGFWANWTRLLRRRPTAVAVGAFAMIAALAVPFFALRLGNSDAGNDPAGTTTREAYDLLARGFGPGFNAPLQLTAEISSPSEEASVAKVVDAVSRQPGVIAVSPLQVIEGTGRQIVLVNVYPGSAPQDAATSKLIDHLRHDVIPKIAITPRVPIYVGGNTAIFKDFAQVLTSKLPVFIGVVVAVSFLLLAVVFRSLVVPLTAAAMNLLSAMSAFGILVAVFQWGWLGRVFGVSRAGPVEAFLPVMLFAILFGLSMDYEVFLISRIHEEWLHRQDNREAVSRGLAATGRTITAAAAIMIVVFGAFILGGERVIKEFGLGLAGAIAVDAVIIRSAVVPSLMLAFGKANWWFPRRLSKWLPRLAVEPLSELATPGELTDVGVR